MILKNERTGDDFTVPPEGARLGRDPSLDVAFPETEDVVSAIHCRVVRREDDTWWLEDLGSTNGTWLNGQRLGEPARLMTGMKFSLGQRGPVMKVTIPGQVARTQAEPQSSLGLPAVRLRRLKGGEDLVAAGREIVIGRSNACPISLRSVADTVVSKRHAAITFDDFGNAFINDLDSRNGTYLNGSAVQGRLRLHAGDRLMLGWQGPVFEMRMVGGQVMSDSEGAPYAPERGPRRSFGGMLAVAGEEAKGSRVLRTGVFMKSMARQIATETSRGFRIAVMSLFAVLMVTMFFVWRSSSQRLAEAEARRTEAERAIQRQVQEQTLAQQRSSVEIARLQQQLDAARRASVSRSVVDSLERRLREQESLAAQGSAAAAPTAGQPHDFTDVARDNSRAVGLVIARFAGDSIMGSGFAITPSGYFVTNRHVVLAEGREMSRQVIVVMAESNVALPADVASVSTVSNQDVAVLRIRGYRGPTVRAIDWIGRGAVQGAPAVMLGFPFGTSMAIDQAGNLRTNLFGGYISQIGDWIRFSGMTYQGVSGSPVFNAAGEVIAVHFGAPREGTGLGISVPMSRVRRWLPADARSELGL